MKDGFYWVIDKYNFNDAAGDAGYPEIARLRGGMWFFTSGNRALDNSPDCVLVISPKLEAPSAYR